MDDYRARAVNRAEAYRKTMDRLHGLSTVTGSQSREENGNDGGPYCIIHDARSHSTEECGLLTEYHRNLAARQQGAREDPGARQLLNGQGN